MTANRFERVRQTASLISDCFDYEPLYTEDARVEKRSYGKFWNLTYRGVKELYPDEYSIFETLGPFKYRPPGGENYYDLFERIEEFGGERAVVSSEGNQLVVTSSAAMLAFRHLRWIGRREAGRNVRIDGHPQWRFRRLRAG